MDLVHCQLGYMWGERRTTLRCCQRHIWCQCSGERDTCVKPMRGIYPKAKQGYSLGMLPCWPDPLGMGIDDGGEGGCSIAGGWGKKQKKDSRLDTLPVTFMRVENLTKQSRVAYNWGLCGTA